MRKIFLYFLFIILFFVSFNPAVSDYYKASPPVVAISTSEELYKEMSLEGIINYKAFEQALEGYKKIESRNDLLTVIDFSKPSTQERFYVLDIINKKLLFVSHVSHGRNSGANYATSFSNEEGSYKSSLGFYLTENTYMGKNGYSLVLDGLEEGINDKAKERAIVIHGAPYSDPKFISSTGRLGRSLGCPALPLSVSKPIINTIKGGSLVYIYAENQNYLVHSDLLN